jgi:adenine-specific DNA-methyltransferase
MTAMGVDVSAELVIRTEARRVNGSMSLDAEQRGVLGQFFTPALVAGLLASMFDAPLGPQRVLDPGAGIGSLSASVVARAVSEGWPGIIDISAVEVDEDLLPTLKQTLHECEAAGATSNLVGADFIEWATRQLGMGLFDVDSAVFDLAILNPPYRKLGAGSAERRALSAVGIEVTNLYSAFVALALRLLKPGGQLVAITPRSFCNGPYFKAFREEVLRSSQLRRIHVFESRDKAFRDSDVLQENIIFHLVKGADQGEVVISSSIGDGSDYATSRTVPFSSVVHLGDPHSFIRIVSENLDSGIANQVRSLPSDLSGIGASVSTGRVVDFRSADHLRMHAGANTVPLLYPGHLRGGRVRWPIADGKKPNGLALNDQTRKLMLPTGNYVLVKRFSSKEERRRVVASVLQDDDLDPGLVAIENHVNVFHYRNTGLSLDVAWGLATYLNSTVVDVYFRQFNGHTQVNATDLRSLRYPSIEQLRFLGTAARIAPLDQESTDSLLDRIVPEIARV